MSLERIWNIFKHCSMNLIDRSYVYLDDQRMELSKLWNMSLRSMDWLVSQIG